MMGRRVGVFALIFMAFMVRAGAADLNIAVDRSTEMPWSAFANGEIVGGIHRDIGVALAQRLGRRPHFVILPRRRVPLALASGQADIACVLLPEWLPGTYRWTDPFVWNGDVVITARTVAQPSSIEALAGEPIGTINGFAYPPLNQALGKNFIRDDAPDASTNLRKLELGHLKHVVVNERYFEYQRRRGYPKVPIYPPLVVARQQLPCALSPASSVPLKALNDAIGEVVRSGELKRMLEAYR